MQRPNILNDTDKYQIDPNDFPRQLDKYFFSAIYNLYVNGAEKIHTVDIDQYLQDNPSAKELIDNEKGIQMLQDCESYAELGNFNYYYNSFKKFALLRELQKSGRDISSFYCENPLHPDYNKINQKFESLKPLDIINHLKGEVAALEDKYSTNSEVEEVRAGEGVLELLHELEQKPEIGLPLQGDIFNTVVRGARLGKLYLRSASSGVGKSRTMVGDCCNLAYPIRYDNVEKRWVATGHCEKVCYVSTEQDISEIQTMILSWLTGINEECFLYGTFELSDSNRIMKAVKIMEQYIDNFYLVRIPDPCASVVKNLFRRYNLQKGIQHFFYDYIFSSPAMLNEYRDLGLAEYVCLRLFTTALKNLAIELNAFIMTATQISNDDDKGGFKDHHQVQGAKQIVNLVDFACIMSRPTPDELKLVSEFGKDFGYKPNVVIDIFKNRRGRWTQVRLWGYNDLGTCRREDIFVTTPDNKPIEELRIIDFEQNKSEELLALEEFYNQQKIGEEEAEPILNAFASIVEASQESHMDHDDNFYITGAFEEQIDKAKRLNAISIGDLL